MKLLGLCYNHMTRVFTSVAEARRDFTLIADARGHAVS
jgi:hypothetical protein